MAGPIAGLAASYLAGKAKNMIEERAGLPSGTLNKMRSPVGIIAGELKDRMLETARDVASGKIKPGGRAGKSGEQMPDTEEDEVDNSASAFKSGGKVRSIDGCARRGKTRGKIV